MDNLIALLLGLYIFFECFTAINEMPKIRLRKFYVEFKNPYTMKYMLLGLYGLAVAYHANEIFGWHVVLAAPAALCVVGRTIYRYKHHTLPQLRYLRLRFKFWRDDHAKRNH